MNHVRYVHRADVVPKLPPQSLGFVHAGALREIGGPAPGPRDDLVGGLGELRAVLTAAARDLKLNTGALPFRVRALADHAPVFYATLLWNAAVASLP
jgi:hypothetical protein